MALVEGHPNTKRRIKRRVVTALGAVLMILLCLPAQAQFLSEFSKHNHKDATAYGDVLRGVVDGCKSSAVRSVPDCLKIYGPVPTVFAGKRKSAVKLVFPLVTGWGTSAMPRLEARPISLNAYCTGNATLECDLVKVSTMDPFPAFKCTSSTDAGCASAKSKFEKARKHLHVPVPANIQAGFPAPCFTYCGPTGAFVAKLLSQEGLEFHEVAGAIRR